MYVCMYVCMHVGINDHNIALWLIESISETHYLLKLQ